MSTPTLAKEISPPPVRRLSGQLTSRAAKRQEPQSQEETDRQAVLDGPAPAAVEAGAAVIDNHLEYFSQRLLFASRTTEPGVPRLGLDAFRELYMRNQHQRGRHFVVHQHDHPIAGVHYDLRLQFSATSTISFAIPYGLPGNPSSIRPNRMAIETRVHNLWNNLIESASHTTGSLLIWDTGEYEVLPYREEPAVVLTDDESQGDSQHQTSSTDSERLFSAFQDKHIRLRLHGCKLPHNYTMSLRLPRTNKHEPRVGPPRKRRRRARTKTHASPESSDTDVQADVASNDDALHDRAAADASEDEEDAEIAANNAYTGATNTIGSVHQRHWFLSLDKVNSGFSTVSDETTVGEPQPFVVFGRDVERSVVTGRTADDIMSDEGVAAFRGRKMWRPIIE